MNSRGPRILMMAVVLTLALGGINTQAEGIFHIATNRQDSMVGTIQSIKRNSFDILDEQDKRIRSFVYFFSERNGMKAGDRVRVHYHGRNSVVFIKKMTPIEYIKGRQNQGYILKSQ